MSALGPSQSCESSPLYVLKRVSPGPGDLASNAWTLMIWKGLAGSGVSGELNPIAEHQEQRTTGNHLVSMGLGHVEPIEAEEWEELQVLPDRSSN